jgi:hypothetical protein
MKKQAIVMILAASLAACSVPTVDELVANPDLLAESQIECADMESQEAANEELCKNAARAQNEINANAAQAVFDNVSDLLKGIFSPNEK